MDDRANLRAVGNGRGICVRAAPFLQRTVGRNYQGSNSASNQGRGQYGDGRVQGRRRLSSPKASSVEHPRPNIDRNTGAATLGHI